MRTVLVFASLVFSMITFVKSENNVILKHSPGSDFLILKCKIIDTSCCTNMKEVEFFKNGNGVCSVTNCQGGFFIPLSRDNAEFYKCGCAERDIRNTYIHVTKYRASDNGNWTCGCYGKENEKKCHSTVMVISNQTFYNGANILNKKLTTCTAHLHYVIICTGLVLAMIIALVVLIWILRRKVQKKHHEERVKNKELEALLNVPDSNSFQLSKEQQQYSLDKLKIQNFVTDFIKEKSESLLLSYLVEDDPILVYNAAFKIFTLKLCLCRHCKSTKEDVICCRTYFKGNGCFTQSQDFVSHCLKKEALLEFFQSIKKGESELPDHVSDYLIKRHEITTEDLKDDVPNISKTNKSFRTLSYTKCKVLLPPLSIEMFSPVPSCIKVAVRNVFPHPNREIDTTV